MTIVQNYYTLFKQAFNVNNFNRFTFFWKIHMY